jgi:tetratricopeptide (TPR) repeat protein
MSTAAPNPLLAKITAYKELLAADPSSNIFVSLSEAYRKMGLLDEAYQVVTKGLISLPGCAPGHVVLARVLCQKDNLSGSIESFLRALELEPDNLAALVGCSRVYLLRQQFSEARQMLIHARELSPADPVINKLLLGLPEPEISAESEQNSALCEKPQRESQPLSESALVANDDLSAAPSPVDEEGAPDESTSAPALETVTLAELYVQQGLSAKASQIYRNLLLRDPDNLDLRRRIRELENSDTAAEGKSPLPLKSDFIDSTVPDTSAAGILQPEPEVEPEPELEFESTPAAAPEPETESAVFSAPTLPVEHADEQNSAVVGTNVLEQLNRLLASIQKRRGDVQNNA